MKSARRMLIWLFFLLVLPVLALWLYVAQPTTAANQPSSLRVSPETLREHVQFLSKDCNPRSFTELENLAKCADYIKRQFETTGAKVRFQEFTVNAVTYRNVIASFGGSRSDLLVVGAHYDAYGDTPGADDNASGVAGLIELAKLVGSSELRNSNLELVAYCLEEPPFFGTEDMGSYHHAKELHDAGVNLRGMVVLEMIGYYSDKRGSQHFPVPVLGLFYPSRGNFIGVIGRLDQRRFTKTVKTGMKGAADIAVYSINAPKAVPGIDFSDHRNYWRFGHNAVMISDSAFYRNRHYHDSGDRAETLDYDRMAAVTVAVFESISRITAMHTD